MAHKLVYVLEDDPDISRLVKLFLSRYGCHVETFGTANDFNQRMKVTLPDICILDVNLPDGDGFEISADLSRTARTTQIPIIVMSARTFSPKKCADSGVKEFVSKPFSIDVFIKAVQRFL